MDITDTGGTVLAPIHAPKQRNSPGPPIPIHGPDPTHDPDPAPRPSGPDDPDLGPRPSGLMTQTLVPDPLAQPPTHDPDPSFSSALETAAAVACYRHCW